MALGSVLGSCSWSLASQQNSTVTRENKTSVSDSMKDNPLMHYYASIYALSMAVMLILKAIRGVVFVKVCGSGQPLLPSPWQPAWSSWACLSLFRVGSPFTERPR